MGTLRAGAQRMLGFECMQKLQQNNKEYASTAQELAWPSEYQPPQVTEIGSVGDLVRANQPGNPGDGFCCVAAPDGQSP